MQENTKISHHVIIDEKALNNLRIIDTKEYEEHRGTYISVCCGSEEECKEFHSHYNEHFFYPLVEEEELY